MLGMGEEQSKDFDQYQFQFHQYQYQGIIYPWYGTTGNRKN
jgi:hypothetical protein